MLGSSISLGAPNIWSASGSINVLDDVLLTLGTDTDVAVVLRSASLATNTTLTNVLEGTPVTPALAANSLIISNITNDGDLLLAASDGGNSKACLFFDASTPDLYLYNVGGTWTAGATTWTLPSFTLGGTVTATSQEIDAAILDACVAKGTWTASGTWTIPAVTLSGTLSANAQAISAAANVTVGTAGFFASTVDDSYIVLSGGIGYTSACFVISGKTRAGAAGYLYLYSPNAALAMAQRLVITGGVNTSVLTWTNVTQAGIVLSDALDVAGQYLTFLERAAPGAGATNEVRVCAIVDGGALTDLAAVFQDGTVDIFAQEVTPLDAPTFIYPSRTEVKTMLKKEHPGLVKIVSVFPNGSEFVLKEIQYHDPEKITANKGAENLLPKDWLVEDASQRAARLEAK